MEVLHARCAGLDVHRDTVVACARIVEDKTVHHHVEQFGTTTVELRRLRDWLSGHGCTHVVVEATGVYWKPVWNVLYGGFELVLANAAHVKNVPGRKTDVNDATWLADLLAHGLVRASFVPDKPLQELRSLLRTRKQLVREKAQHVQRIEKTLQDANIKLTSCISDIMGQSGRAMLQALIDGETEPERLLSFASSRLKAPRSEILEALRGHVTSHHRFLLRLHLEQIVHLEAAIATLTRRSGTAWTPSGARWPYSRRSRASVTSWPR
jgi:transposase